MRCCAVTAPSLRVRVRCCQSIERALLVCGVRSAAVRRRAEVRERDGLAKLFRADRRLNRYDGRSQPWDDAHRSALQPVRRAPGSRISRRSSADRIALLHQRRGVELQTGALEQDRSSGSAAGRMLAVAAELDLVARLLAVITAVLPERSLRLDGAVAGRVSAFRRSSHVDPPLVRIYASSRWRTRYGGVG